MSETLTRRQVSQLYRRGDPRLFEQDVWWRPGFGRSVLLEEMTPEHRENLIDWMLFWVAADEERWPDWTDYKIRRCPLYRRLKELKYA